MTQKPHKKSPISVVIVNHNAGSLLTDCVHTALEQAHQVIVVDNASTDNSLTELQVQFSQEQYLQLIPQNTNLGFATGCNIGLAAATDPYILFLNPDCILKNNALQCMLEALESNKRIGMVGGLLTNPDGTEQGGGRRTIPTPWRSFVRGFGLYRLQKFWPNLFADFHLHGQTLPDESIEVEAISGALMLVRHKAIEEVGPWDEGYFLHCEDLDWCMRFTQKGWKILFVPDAPVVHYKGVCSQARPIFVAWHKHKGMIRFYQKFFRDQYSKPFMWLIIASTWLRFGVIALYHLAHQAYSLVRVKNA